MEKDIPLLVELVQTSQNWEELNKALLESRLVDKIYSDRGKFVDLVHLVWSNNYKHKEQEGVFPIPGKKISIGTTNFYIHGLVHNSPYFSLNNEFKEYISDKLKNYEVLCEDGFSEWIESSVSFNETNHFKFNRFRPETIKNTLNYLFGRKTFTNDSFLKKARTLKDLNGLLDIREYLFMNYLPEPLGMNSFLYGVGTIAQPNVRLPLILKRYIYETEAAINHAENNKLSEVHVIVGCRHELPLEYLIKNSNILENFK